MSTAAVANFDAPDESRRPERTKVDVVNTEQGSVARLTLSPGWTWESCIKPVAGTESCQTPHLGYVESGKLKVTPDGGEPMEVSAGSVYALAPGHHAEVVGDEDFVAYEFDSSTAQSYAQHA